MHFAVLAPLDRMSSPSACLWKAIVENKLFGASRARSRQCRELKADLRPRASQKIVRGRLTWMSVVQKAQPQVPAASSARTRKAAQPHRLQTHRGDRPAPVGDGPVGTAEASSSPFLGRAGIMTRSTWQTFRAGAFPREKSRAKARDVIRGVGAKRPAQKGPIGVPLLSPVVPAGFRRPSARSKVPTANPGPPPERAGCAARPSGSEPRRYAGAKSFRAPPASAGLTGPTSTSK